MIISILPFSYALVGTLYIGFQLMNLYPDYSIDNVTRHIQLPYLCLWGLLSILFWIPAIAKIHSISLLHGLVFFFIIGKDIFLELTGKLKDHHLVRNEMIVYTTSIALNFAAFILVLVSSKQILRKKQSNT